MQMSKQEQEPLTGYSLFMPTTNIPHCHQNFWFLWKWILSGMNKEFREIYFEICIFVTHMIWKFLKITWKILQIGVKWFDRLSISYFWGWQLKQSSFFHVSNKAKVSESQKQAISTWQHHVNYSTLYWENTGYKTCTSSFEFLCRKIWIFPVH